MRTRNGKQSYGVGRSHGRTLFRGFFLGHGPVAKLFPELYGHVEPPTELVTAKEDALMDRISKAQPNFFGHFEKLMNSGSRVDVEKALDEGSDRLAEALAPELGVTADDVRQGRTGKNAGTQLGIIVFVAAAAAVVALVVGENTAALHYVSAITRYVWFWNKGGAARELFPGYEQESQLARDRFINVVVKRLGSQPTA